jgi:hypothetical protein
MVERDAVIRADHKNGSVGSLYIKHTGRQDRNVIDSRKRIVKRIRRMVKGLINFMV